MAVPIAPAVIAMLTAIVLIGAGNTPTPEIFARPTLTSIISGVTVVGEPYSFKTEHFVVANAPGDERVSGGEKVMICNTSLSLQNSYPELAVSRSAMTIAGILFLMLFASSAGSADSPPEIKIFPRPALTTIDAGVYQGKSYNVKSEYFVVTNPPRTEPEIRAVIGTYTQSKLAADQQEGYTMTVRFYYRETKSTPRDYVESVKGYFDHDRIEYHADDLLVAVRWRRGSDHLEYHFPLPRQSR